MNKTDNTGYWANDVHSGALLENKVKNKMDYALSKMDSYYVPYNKSNGDYYGTYYWAKCIGFDRRHAYIIAFNCNDVDSEFNPVFYQSWHFNTNPSDQVDSRIIIMTFMLLAAMVYFDEAENLKLSGKHYSTWLDEGLKYLGYALHPVQDYFAHTDDKVYDLYYTPGFLVFKSHIRLFDDTDNAIKRWGQLQKTKEVTENILKTFYNEYPILFKR